MRQKQYTDTTQKRIKRSLPRWETENQKLSPNPMSHGEHTWKSKGVKMREPEKKYEQQVGGEVEQANLRRSRPEGNMGGGLVDKKYRMSSQILKGDTRQRHPNHQSERKDSTGGKRSGWNNRNNPNNIYIHLTTPQLSSRNRNRTPENGEQRHKQDGGKISQSFLKGVANKLIPIQHKQQKHMQIQKGKELGREIKNSQKRRK